MDPVVLTIAIRGALCLALIWGGFKQVAAGFKLYRNEHGSPNDDVLVEFKGVKFKSKSVGSIVMATAAVWAFLAVYVAPNYESGRRGVRVYSLQSQDLSAHVPEVSASADKQTSAKEALSEPEQLKTLFKEAMSNRPGAEPVTLNSQPAKLDLSNVTVSKNSDGTLKILTPAQADGTHAQVSFTSEAKGKEVIFTPDTVKKSPVQ